METGFSPNLNVVCLEKRSPDCFLMIVITPKKTLCVSVYVCV